MPGSRPKRLPRVNQRPGLLTLPCHPIAGLIPVGSVGPEGLSLANWARPGRSHGGTGISTGCPSTTPHGLALGPDLPWADEPSPGTLGLSAGEILTPLSLLMPAFSLQRPPRLAHAAASLAAQRSPTDPAAWTPPRRMKPSLTESRSFGAGLEPRYIFRAESLDQ